MASIFGRYQLKAFTGKLRENERENLEAQSVYGLASVTLKYPRSK